MAEYIERESLIKRLCERCNEEMSESPCEPSDCFAREVIKTIPAADVAQVVHGRWVWDSTNDRYACSRCNKEPSGDCNGGCVCHLSDYCPNCGAKMDLEEV